MSGGVFEDGDPFNDPAWQQAKASKAKKGKTFVVTFTRLPESWAVALEKLDNASAWRLARRILRAAHEQEHTMWPRPIVLSEKMTGLAKTTRLRATSNLVRLGLIEIEHGGIKQAPVVVKLFLDGGKVRELQRRLPTSG